MRRQALAIATMLACCAPRPEIPVSAVRAKLVGLAPNQVQACMGPPTTSRARGSTLLYTYSSADAQIVPVADPSSADFDYSPFSGDPQMPGLGSSGGPMSRTGCLVNIVMDGGRVRTVNF